MIRLLKLITGEDILAEVDGEDVDCYVLKNPVRFVPTPEGLALAPLLMFSKSDTITIDKEKVMFECEPDDKVSNAYNAEYGTGIVMPPSGLQLP